MLTLRGAPTLYYGDEIGMEDGFVPKEKYSDPQAFFVDPKISRDPVRTPMQWNKEPNAGFSDHEDPWLPTAGNYLELNVEKQERDTESDLAFYRKIVWLRQKSDILMLGDYEAILQNDSNTDDDIFGFKRTFDNKELRIFLNFASEAKSIRVEGELVLSTYLKGEKSKINGDYVLKPFEGIIVSIN